MPRRRNNIRGEALLETVIAFITLAIGVTIAGMIMGSSLRNMQNAKNRVMAVNLAREGIEAVRNVRDTNWLKFHSKRRACWNNMPSVDPDENCVGSTPIWPGIWPGRYIVYKQGGYPAQDNKPTYRWLLGEYEWGAILPGYSTAQPCTNDGEYYHNTSDTFTYRCNGNTSEWENIGSLSVVDIDPMVDTSSDGDYKNDQDFYNHLYAYPESNNNPLGSFVSDTVFIRVIKIEYVDNMGKIYGAGWNPADDENINRMRVTSTVTWHSGTHWFKVELVTHLTDYLGREHING